jgi:hypothetical protein
VESIREDLFEYLVGRLASRPLMVREFAEAIMGMGMEDLVKIMVPHVSKAGSRPTAQPSGFCNLARTCNSAEN